MDRTPFLDGDHVSLYAVEEDDLERLRDIVNNQDAWTWININTPQNMRNEHNFYEHLSDDDKQITLLVYSKDADEVLGTVEFRLKEETSRVAEFGIVLDPDHHSNGIGTEATQLMLSYGFNTLNLHKIWARALDHNEKSIGLLKKVGLTEEGRLREHAYVDGEYRDFNVFGILAREWNSKDQ